jgi:signal transduction histidine kinase
MSSLGADADDRARSAAIPRSRGDAAVAATAAHASAWPEATRERRAWPAWAIVVTFWLGSSVLYAAQIAIMSTMPGENFRLAVLLAWQVPFWLLWAALAPVVLWLGERFPFDGQRWRRSLPVHAGAWLALACGHAAMSVAISKLLDSTSTESYWMAFRGFVMSRVHIELMVYAATLGVGYGLEYRRRLRERELSASRLEAQLANARLDALRMQLNPHFLFNTLHTVAALVRGQRNDEAVTMIAGLSDLLRRTLDGQTMQETSLADELTFVERYLDIQRVRFGDRLQVDMRIDPAARDARVPTLILQPLVENALRHGLAPRAAAGLLTIAATRDGGRLRLEVQDDGIGWQSAARGTRGSARASAAAVDAEDGARSGAARKRRGGVHAADGGPASDDGQSRDRASGDHASGDGASGDRAIEDSARMGGPGAAGKNSGGGSAESQSTNATDVTPGVGLANTRSRLQHLYGEAARLDLDDAPGGGARVRVEIPFREASS